MKTTRKPSDQILKKMKNYTPFQQAVWKACFTIPKGETRTYGWIARQIRCPRSVRAVGHALKINPFAPYIPCHRVVPSTGGIGYYSGPGGKKQKMRLLLQEGALKK